MPSQAMPASALAPLLTPPPEVAQSTRASSLHRSTQVRECGIPTSSYYCLYPVSGYNTDPWDPYCTRASLES